MRYILLAILLISCGPVRHLRLAEYHLKQAERKGAKINTDTTYKKISIDIKGPGTSIGMAPIFNKPSPQYKYILKDTILYRDSIQIRIKHDTIDVKCPDVHQERKVPVAMTTTISAGYSKLELIGSVLVGVIMTVIVAIAVSGIKK